MSKTPMAPEQKKVLRSGLIFTATFVVVSVIQRLYEGAPLDILLKDVLIFLLMGAGTTFYFYMGARPVKRRKDRTN